jgi:16S rRNA processing protein RimM
MKKRALPPLLPAGFFAKLQGFKGDLVLAVEQGEPEAIGRAPYLFVELEGRPVPYRCEESRLHRGDLIVHLEGIDSAAAAGPLLQAAVYAERKRVREDREEPGWDQLIGFEAVDSVHGSLGPITEVQEFPMQFLARCVVNGTEVLLPLNDSTVLEIDEDKVFFNLPSGLLDVYLQPDTGEKDEEA